MTQTQTQGAWDFSHVYSFNDTYNSTQTSARSPASQQQTTRSPVHEQSTPSRDGTSVKLSNGLGDFSSIWQYLGSPIQPSPDAPAPAPNASPTLEKRVPEKFEYTSDGAIYSVPIHRKSKAIQWRDETTDGAFTDVAPSKSDDENADRLSKKQRYKRNKKERQRLEKEEAARRAASDIESEAEYQRVRSNPARKASSHNLRDAAITQPSTKYNLRQRDTNGNTVTPPAPIPASSSSAKPTIKAEKSAADLVPAKPMVKEEKAVAVPPSDKTTLPASSSKSPPKAATNIKPPTNGFISTKSSSETAANTKPITSEVKPQPKITNKQPETPAAKSTQKEWPVSTAQTPKSKSLVPATVQPPATAPPVRSTAADKESIYKSSDPTIRYVESTPTRSGRTVIQPKIIRSGEDRNWAFLLKLISNFYEDRGCLIKPANLSNHSNDPKGVHVFVDASNIFIGFLDQLKRARNIPQYVRVPQVNMSFDALALLMERRRPVAKRVLAGSTPEVPAFNIAREIGYECSILERVRKAKELTERQRYFQAQDAKRRDHSRNRDGEGNSNGYVSGGSSESTGYVAPTHAPEKLIEQGVDEILHLKILESVVDFEEPTTIVLATGDAAIAEYSQGFMVMVERALKKGWAVELVSWSMNISQMYKRQAFRGKWGDKFKIIELDDYAEELLDM
ncbi:hypothetical protein MBLNU457_2227t1 [Dothideomycetes sp. NU457]